MLVKLIKYEIIKRWKIDRYILIGYTALQTLLLIVMRVFLWNSDAVKIFGHGVKNGSNVNIGVPFGLAIAIYFFAAMFLLFYPMLENIYHYGRDLSGRQAALELMIPVISWKKVAAKLIASVLSAVIYAILALVSILLFAIVAGIIDKVAVDSFLVAVRYAAHSPIKYIWGLLYSVFSLASMYIVIFFCIAFARSFSHKNKIALPIGILTFSVLIAALVTIQVQVDKFPIVKYSIAGIYGTLSSSLFEIILFSATFIGTSWLIEKRIEH